MGITIEDCIKELLINKEDDTYVLGNETIDFAIDIMRKYKKIQEIINNTDYIQEDVIRYKMICEVVEDGNN